jgi:transposase
MKETAVSKEKTVSKAKTRKKYDPTFKREAVALWQNSGKSAREIAQQLGIQERHLYDWKTTGVAGPQGDLRAENVALRQELALVRQQRDILKKTLGIISEPLKSATNGSPR